MEAMRTIITMQRAITELTIPIPRAFDTVFDGEWRLISEGVGLPVTVGN